MLHESLSLIIQPKTLTRKAGPNPTLKSPPRPDTFLWLITQYFIENPRNARAVEETLSKFYRVNHSENS